MQAVLTTKQTKALEEYLKETSGVPSLLLMEYAASAVFETVMKHAEHEVLVFAGTGNNGADGLAVARMLANSRVGVTVCVIGNIEHASVEWQTQKKMLDSLYEKEVLFTGLESLDENKRYDAVVDALLGIGLNRPVSGEYLAAVCLINDLKKKTKCKVIAVDIPTGLSSDTGDVLGYAVYADETVTFFAIKRGCLISKGRTYTGEVQLIEDLAVNTPDINRMYQDGLLSLGSDELLPLSLEEDDVKDIMHRNPSGNKSNFGKVLCVCGSKGMPGACILNARACFAAGAGMVKVLSYSENLSMLMHEIPEAMFAAYDKISYKEMEENVSWCDCVVIGCGLGKNALIMDGVLEVALAKDKPIVIDADGLNHIANNMNILTARKAKGLITVITPHPGEWSRLFPDTSCSSPESVAQKADEIGGIIVAKNATTIVTDGNNVYLNDTGNDGMATAGSGDVLSGIIAAFVSKTVKSEGTDMDHCRAVASAVWFHGKAGDIAAKEKSAAAMLPSDMIRNLPNVYK